ncbi:MAG: transcriptional repressor [Spirochaetales bacterium]
MYSTEQRNALLNFFEKHPDELLTAQEILNALAHESISRSAIYRNLAQLESAEKIKKHIKQGSKTLYYQYVHGAGCKGKLHLHCTQCDRTFHMKDTETQSITESVSQNDDFIVDKVATVLYGTCKNCTENKGEKE